MAKDRLSGKLAVILHADVAGSTQLVQQDEQLAHQRIQDAFRRFGDTISKYYGQVRELRGDALLAEFERASDAVTAALAFQAEQNHYNAQLNDQLQPTVRVGIAMGEVVIADNTITGTGVVLAQRLEQLADPGGVVIQGAAYETIPGRFPFDFVNLGEHEVKGFDEPVRVFSANLKTDTEIPPPDSVTHKTRNTVIAFVSLAVVIVGVALMWVKPWEIREEPALLERMAFPLPSKPSIAVLAFDNLSGDRDQEYLSDGISEGIIRELSRFPQLFVIARNSSFTYKGKPVKIQKVSEELGVRYVVEGSLQSSDDQIRVTAQLIDATTGNHLWSNLYDGNRQDFFVVQDEITQKIVSTIAGRVELVERRRVLDNPVERLKAYEYVQQGWAQWYKWTKEANDQARKLHEKALQLDPDYAEAYVGLTFVNFNNIEFSNTGLTREESLDLAFEMAQKATQISPFYYRSHLALANVYLRLGNPTQAMAEYDKALELNPNATKVLASAAEVLVQLGRAEEAVDQIKLAMRLNPYHPDWYLWNLGSAQYFSGEYNDALTTVRRMRNPPNAVKRTQAIILARLGRLEESRMLASEFLQGKPDYNYEEYMKSWHFKDGAYQDKLAEDLRKAGLSGKPPALLPDKPSIAVLPFINLSGDPKQEYLSDGISESIITALSHVSEIFIIARQSAFSYKGKALKVQQIAEELGVHYVLEGSVQRSDSRIRVSAQLVDAADGHHLWAQQYDRQWEDIFALLDDITQHIVANISSNEGPLLAAILKQVKQKAPTDLRAYDYLLLGREYLLLATEEDNARARELFQKAVEVDPNYSLGHAWLAWAYHLDVSFGWSDESTLLFEKALYHAQKAVELDNTEADAHWVLGAVLVYLQEQPEVALAEYETALSLNPNDADILADYGWSLARLGRADDGVDFIEKAIRLNPFHPDWYGEGLMHALYLAKRYHEVIAVAKTTRMGTISNYLDLAGSYAQLGQLDAAQETAAKILDQRPDFSIGWWRERMKLADPADLDHYLDGLYKAGLPK